MLCSLRVATTSASSARGRERRAKSILWCAPMLAVLACARRLRLTQQVDDSQSARKLRRPLLFGRRNLRKSLAYSKVEDMNTVLRHRRFPSPNPQVPGCRVRKKRWRIQERTSGVVQNAKLIRFDAHHDVSLPESEIAIPRVSFLKLDDHG